MSNADKAIDRFAVAFANSVIRFRWLVILLTLLAVTAVASGGRYLDFATNYRVFFSS